MKRFQKSWTKDCRQTHEIKWNIPNVLQLIFRDFLAQMSKLAF